MWENRLNKLLDRFLVTNFKHGVSFEPNCEPNKGCNSDMLWFKGTVVHMSQCFIGVNAY